MHLNLDDERFDALQLHLVAELLRVVRDGLREAGVVDDQTLYEATGNLGFAVAALFDGSRIIELQGEPVLPFLTFAQARNGDTLTATAGGSSMHEHVFAILDDVFDDEPATPDPD